MKRHLLTIVKFAFSIAILYYLFNKARQDEQFAALAETEKRYGWLLVSVLAVLGATLISFVRWWVMVRALDLPFRIRDAVRIGFIGMFFNLFAFGVLGGDTLRAFYVTRTIKRRVPEAIASVFADRFIGLLTMFTFAAVAFLLWDQSAVEWSDPGKQRAIRFIGQLATAVTVCGYLGLFTLLFTPRVRNTQWYQQIESLPKVGSIVTRLTDVVILYRSRPLAIIICFVASIGVNLCFAIAIYSVAAGIAEHYPTFADHFLIEPISMVANAVPLPGGLGGMEFALDFLYQAFNTKDSLGKNPGVVVAFGFRIALLLVSAIGAVVWFMNRGEVKGLASSEHSIQN